MSYVAVAVQIIDYMEADGFPPLKMGEPDWAPKLLAYIEFLREQRTEDK